MIVPANRFDLELIVPDDRAQAARRLGLSIGGMPAGADRDATIEARYHRGDKIRDIANAAGLTPRGVNHILRVRGVLATRHTDWSQVAGDVVALYRSGASLMSIARLYNSDASTVRGVVASKGYLVPRGRDFVGVPIDDIRLTVNLLRNGATVDDIIASVLLTEEQVRAIATAHGLEVASAES